MILSFRTGAAMHAHHSLSLYHNKMFPEWTGLKAGARRNRPSGATNIRRVFGIAVSEPSGESEAAPPSGFSFDTCRAHVARAHITLRRSVYPQASRASHNSIGEAGLKPSQYVHVALPRGGPRWRSARRTR